MNVKEINDKNAWDNFFNAAGSPSFHQSWEWGEFQKRLSYGIIRLGVYEGANLVAIALVIKIRSKRGNFLFVPHGPILKYEAKNLTINVPESENNEARKILTILKDYLVNICKKEKFSFIRIAPILGNSPSHRDLFASVGFRTAPIYIHAETMWVIDISQPEEQIMHNMRKTTRYLVNKGMRDGLTVSKHDKIDALQEFWKLYQTTYAREHFTPFPKSYIAGEFESFHETNNSLFFLGKIPQKFAQEGTSRILAGSLVLFTKSTGFYHQGASVHTKYPVTYVLQWQSILSAKSRGCQYYNMYGIYKPGRTPASWQGLTLFKMGFGGFQVDYLETQDYIVSKKYYLSYCIDRYLAWRRGIGK